MTEPQHPPAASVRLFQFRGIPVFLHWSWFIVAVFEIGERAGSYSSVAWNVAEYLALFGIVLLHEFGHAFACRSVGGRSNQIILWPLGGVAYVEPPPRPGATLWSIAAGPLVNLVLLPILGILTATTRGPSPSDLHAFFRSLTVIDAGLLLFNLLPVYPLDGGQILGALLWFVIGRARSMMVTAVVGFAGALGLALLAVSTFSVWLGLMAYFVFLQCIAGWRAAKVWRRMSGAPRRDGFACPSCFARPPSGAFWKCAACGSTFDVFDGTAEATAGVAPVTTRLDLSLMRAPVVDVAAAEGICPVCHEPWPATCTRCGAISPVQAWRAAALP
jgi:Zn-dependent protease